LSILLQIKKRLPNESIVYLADQANVPYGSKSQEELKQFAENAVNFLLSKKVKLIIIACNTATVYTLDSLRSKFNIPITGTVPVVKTLVEKTKTGKVAVFSTPATAKSHYLSDLIRHFADGKKVFIIGETNLETLVEKGKLEDPRIDQIFKKHLLPLISKGVDSIALACTHYPFLKNKMNQVLKGKIKIFDSGGAVARQAKRVLKNNKALAENSNPKFEFFTSGDTDEFRRVGRLLTELKLDQVGKAEI
jgi:glutamate racemase